MIREARLVRLHCIVATLACVNISGLRSAQIANVQRAIGRAIFGMPQSNVRATRAAAGDGHLNSAPSSDILPAVRDVLASHAWRAPRLADKVNALRRQQL